MPKNNTRFERINEELKKEISHIINYELNNPNVTGLISVTKAKVTPDLKYAKIMVSILNSKNLKETLAGLKKSSGYIRTEIAKSINKDISTVAKEIKKEIGKEVKVMIIDTDATYMKNGKYFTGLPIAIEGIDADNGFFGYLKGQMSENMGSTPLGCSEEIDVETALKIANIAEDYQKSLETEMKTIHSVKEVLGTEIDEVTIEDLDSITHTPAVIIRKC